MPSSLPLREQMPSLGLHLSGVVLFFRRDQMSWHAHVGQGLFCVCCVAGDVHHISQLHPPTHSDVRGISPCAGPEKTRNLVSTAEGVVIASKEVHVIK